MPTKGSTVQSGSREPTAADAALVAVAKHMSGQVTDAAAAANKIWRNRFINSFITANN